MCESCDCKVSNKLVQYKCQCPEKDCNCGIIEFDEEPKAKPYCCGLPMRKIK